MEAFKWYYIAAELGVANASRYRERVAKELKLDERLKAGELAVSWLQAKRLRRD
jgi:TPR repeat protein